MSSKVRNRKWQIKQKRRLKNDKKIDIAVKFNLFNEIWVPKIAAELNNDYIKLDKFHGEFLWHKHDEEDELF